MGVFPWDLLHNWKVDPGSALALSFLGLIYAWAWRRLRRRGARLATGGRLILFAAGLSALAVAFLSPLAALQQEYLLARSLQQVLVGLLAPPLLWLGCPFHTIALGLPAPGRRLLVKGLKKRTLAGRLVRGATHPLAAWMFAFSLFLLWHEPAIADWLLARPDAYVLGLWCVWLAYMLFWWHPLGTGPRLRRPMAPGVGFFYIVVGGEAPNMVTGVTLAFRRTPAYSYYADRLGGPGLTEMQDQMISGGIIWFLGSIVYVGFAFALLGRVFRNFRPPIPPPISWDASERTIAPGLEHRVAGQNME